MKGGRKGGQWGGVHDSTCHRSLIDLDSLLKRGGEGQLRTFHKDATQRYSTITVINLAVTTTQKKKIATDRKKIWREGRTPLCINLPLSIYYIVLEKRNMSKAKTKNKKKELKKTQKKRAQFINRTNIIIIISEAFQSLDIYSGVYRQYM